MPLHLTLENETALPDGGPISITVTQRRGIDIGRDQYLDWVLPDPTRFISGKHCEVRYRDGRYWLQDVSTNGTFVNGSEFRIDGAHALRSGDRIEIGKYIVAVVVEADADDAPGMGGAAVGQPQSQAMWDMDGPAAPSINPQELRMPSIASGLSAPDPLDWISDLQSSTPVSDTQDTGWNWSPPASGGAPAFTPEEPPARRPAPAPDPIFGDEPTEPARMPQVAPPQAFAAPEPGDTLRRPAPPPAAPAPPPQPPAAREQTATARDAPPRMEAPAPAPAPAQNYAAPGYAAPVSGGPGSGAQGNVKAAFARGAGIDPGMIAAQSDEAFAEMLGAFVRLTTDNLRQLHDGRAKSKGAMRSANTTMIQAMDNNPLRFSPTTEDALRLLLGPPTTSYLNPKRALESSFNDLKAHQLAVFSAMQQAVMALLEDLDPAKIDAQVDTGKGVGSLLRARQVRLWEHYETTWKAKVGKSEHGMLNVFMQLFSRAYDGNG